jgi:glycosyltransferase involved in cell wall biosynthesis
MKSDNLPSISCVIATFNSADTAKHCLNSVSAQNYPKNKIEIIIADGGSTDNTLSIVSKFKARIVKIPKEKQEAEYNKGTGISNAKNELILSIDIDNVLPHKNWLRNMVKPLVENKQIIGSEALRFNYNPKDLILDRYFALLGETNPIPYYLGKDSKLSWAFDKYNLLGRVRDMGNYYLVKFKNGKIPTIGANGAILRRSLLKYAKSDPQNYFHTDVIYDLTKKGFDEYSFVKEDIIHFKRTKFSYFLKFLLRRKYIMETQYFEKSKKRRYSVYDPKQDKLNLVKYVIYSTTFIKPLYDAFKGFLKVRDVAWFLHPVVCFSYVVVYSWAVLARKAR